MTTKCTGLMGRIFGHKFQACASYNGDLIVAKRLSTLEIARIKYDAGLTDAECRIFMICQRCGAVAGEKK